MSNKEYIGIAVDGEYIVAVKGVKHERGITISGAYKINRKGGVREDLKRLGEKFPLKNFRSAIAIKGETQTELLRLPKMSAEEVREMLKWQIGDYITWEKDTYYYDFMTMKGRNSDKKMNVFVVAVKKEEINALAEGMTNIQSAIEIIDYWPAPILHVVEDEKNFNLLVVEEGKTKQYRWSEGALLYKRIIESEDPEAVMEDVEASEAALLEETGINTDKILVFVSKNSIYKKEWEALLTLHPAINNVSICVESQAKFLVDMSELNWNVALGLACRGLKGKG